MHRGLTSFEAMLEACALAFGVPRSVLLGRGRAAQHSHPRQATIYVMRRRFERLSYPRLGRLFDGRDHSAIIHACHQTEARMARDPVLARKIAALIALPLFREPPDLHVRAWHLARGPRARSLPAGLAVLAPAPEVAAEDDSLAAFRDGERLMCGQCDRAVRPREAANCRARLCPLRQRGAA